MRGQHPRDFVLQLKPLQYFKLQMGERMHSHKALSSLFSLHCGPIILTCNHKSHSDNWLSFFFLSWVTKSKLKMKLITKTDVSSLLMTGKH